MHTNSGVQRSNSGVQQSNSGVQQCHDGSEYWLKKCIDCGLITFNGVCKSLLTGEADTSTLKMVLRSHRKWINQKIEVSAELMLLLNKTQLMRKFNVLRLFVKNISLLGIAIAVENEEMQRFLLINGADKANVAEAYYNVDTMLSAECLLDVQKLSIKYDTKDTALAKLRITLAKYGVK